MYKVSLIMYFKVSGAEEKYQLEQVILDCYHQSSGREAESLAWLMNELRGLEDWQRQRFYQHLIQLARNKPDKAHIVRNFF